MSRSMKLVLVALLVATPAIGASPLMIDKPAVPVPDPYLDVPRDCPETCARGMLSGTVAAAFFRSDFSQIDVMEKYYLNSGARTPAGSWKLAVLYEALYPTRDLRNPDDDYPFRNA
jgi:hypothetical protein